MNQDREGGELSSPSLSFGGSVENEPNSALSGLTTFDSVIGVDPSPTATGACIIRRISIRGPQPSPVYEVQTGVVKTESGMPQFHQKLVQMRWLHHTIRSELHQIAKSSGKLIAPVPRGSLLLAIEQPYVRGANQSGSGGHQSANMWALYNMMLAVAAEYKIPTVAFNITQFHSLIEPVKGLSKTRIVELAKLDCASLKSKRLSSHEADAYFLAKFGRRFWDIKTSITDGDRTAALFNTPKKEQDIFLSTEGKNGPRGMYHRKNDMWFDWREEDEDTSAPFTMKRVEA